MKKFCCDCETELLTARAKRCPACAKAAKRDSRKKKMGVPQLMAPAVLNWDTKPLVTFYDGCQWPMWSNRPGPSPRFCNATKQPGEIYCTEHCNIAYTSGWFNRRKGVA